MRTEVKLITPQLAQIYLGKNKANRTVSQRTIDYYASQMERNLWRLTGQGISFDENNNLIDGQHRLHAVLKSKKSVQMLVIFDVQRISSDVYDTGKNRNVADVFTIEGIANSKKLSAAIQSYNIYKKGFIVSHTSRIKELKLTRFDFLQAYHEKPEFWETIIKISTRCYHKIRLYRESTICGFYSFLVIDKKRNPEFVESFFLQLHGIDPDKYSCTKILREYLIRDAMALKKLSLQDKNILLIKTWNNFENKRNVRSITLVKGEVPQEII